MSRRVHHDQHLVDDRARLETLERVLDNRLPRDADQLLRHAKPPPARPPRRRGRRRRCAHSPGDTFQCRDHLGHRTVEDELAAADDEDHVSRGRATMPRTVADDEQRLAGGDEFSDLGLVVSRGTERRRRRGQFVDKQDVEFGVDRDRRRPAARTCPRSRASPSCVYELSDLGEADDLVEARIDLVFAHAGGLLR